MSTTSIACTAFGVVIAIVTCQPINPLPATVSPQTIGEDAESECGEKNDVSAKNTCDEETLKDGEGLYKDPMELLGCRFPRSCMTDLCESRVKMRADAVVHDVRFTRRGTRLCAEVCSQYRENMLKNRVSSTDVHAWPGYCDYVGAEERPVGMQDLRARCTCAYKVRCNRRTDLMLYSFEADAEGNVRVSVTESDREHYVTAYLRSRYLQQHRQAAAGEEPPRRR